MSTINLCLWATGLVLQAGLVAALLLRRLARRFPIFTILIVFYTLRSAILFASFGYVSRTTYAVLYDAFSWADLCMQILLAMEIASCVLRQTGMRTRRYVVRAAVLLVMGTAMAASAAAALPAQGRVPVDRGAAFTSVLMLLLLLWMILAGISGAPRRIAEGFAVYGVSGVLAGMARSYSALHRNTGAYAAASYAQAGIYMAVVVFWLFALRAQRVKPASSFTL